MTQGRWEQLSDVFGQARELPPRERADFITRACAADRVLRAEAQSLVDADAASHDFMTEPALQQLAQQMARDGWSVRPGDAPYDVSPDGERIYFLRRNDDPAPNDLRVVVGWRALLR